MGRGRPKGSKNKVKVIPSSISSIDNREIKQQIRKLRKLKRDTQKKTDARRQINQQIRDLKEQLTAKLPEVKQSSAREALIQEIYKYNPDLERLGVDMNKYTDEQLNIHLTKIKTRGQHESICR
jgi:predicted transcriptional regulator